MANKPIGNTDCHCLKLRRSAENVIAFYDHILSPSGVTVRQYSLLSAIGTRKECSVSQLAEATELDRSTLARSLKPLFNRGLILDLKQSRARDSRLVLSEQGIAVRDHAAALWAEAQAAFETKLGGETVKMLETALAALQTL